MTGLGSFFDTRASFELAMWVVVWLAISMLVLIVVNLHLRLRRLEAQSPAVSGARPFGHLVGRAMHDLVGTQESELSAFRVLVFLSEGCRSCERILAELEQQSWKAPSALLWTDRTPSPPPKLPAGTTLLEDGPTISRGLGIRVTPFAVVADRNGRVVRASPINSLSSLDDDGGASLDRRVA